MEQRQVTIINKLGLHARAATKLVKTAEQFAATVEIEKNSAGVTRRINGKSILGVMMLAAAKGSEITLIADGADETAALDALVALVEDYFGEGE